MRASAEVHHIFYSVVVTGRDEELLTAYIIIAVAAERRWWICRPANFRPEVQSAPWFLPEAGEHLGDVMVDLFFGAEAFDQMRGPAVSMG